jgi:hypothetical protein
MGMGDGGLRKEVLFNTASAESTEVGPVMGLAMASMSVSPGFTCRSLSP